MTHLNTGDWSYSIIKVTAHGQREALGSGAMPKLDYAQFNENLETKFGPVRRLSVNAETTSGGGVENSFSFISTLDIKPLHSTG